MYSASPHLPSQSDSAVSPVVATLLIVALTIVIVGIFGTFVLGMVNPAALSGKIIAVTGEPYGTVTDHGVRMTLWDSKDLDQLESIRAEVGGYGLFTADGKTELTDFVVGMKYDFSLMAGFQKITDVRRGTGSDNTVGGTKVSTTNFRNASALVGEQVSFVGTFKDGTEQVIYLWKISIPGVEAGSETYLGGDGNISITGFSNNTIESGHGVAGHGLLITALNPKVTKVEIIDYTLKGASDGNNNTYKKSDNIFRTTTLTFESATEGYLSLKAHASDETFGITPGATISSALRGDVKLKITLSGGKPYENTFTNVYIPARDCVLVDGRHTIQKVIYNATNNIKFTLNSITNQMIKEDNGKNYIVTYDGGSKEGTIKSGAEEKIIPMSIDIEPGKTKIKLYVKYKSGSQQSTEMTWYLIYSGPILSD